MALIGELYCPPTTLVIIRLATSAFYEQQCSDLVVWSKQFSIDLCINRNIQFNPLPHTTHLQQATLKTSWQKYGKSLKISLLNRIETIVTNGDIAHDENFFPLVTVFSKLICCK